MLNNDAFHLELSMLQLLAQWTTRGLLKLFFESSRKLHLNWRTHKAHASLLIAGCLCVPVCRALQVVPPAAPAAEGQAPEATPQASDQSTASSGPQLKPNPLVALRAFEPSADEEYRLGKGDAIVVDFAGQPDLQAKLTVGPDGRISLPLAGEILLNGLTRQEG